MNDAIKQLYDEYQAVQDRPSNVKAGNWDNWTDEDNADYDKWRNAITQKGDELREMITHITDDGYIRKQAEVVADFWCSFLSSDTPPKFDMGNDMNTRQGVMVQMLGNLSVSEAHVSIASESIELFRQSIIASILKEVAPDKLTRHLSLGVDYHPDMVLSEALKSASITNEMILPIKTICTITDIEVVARVGYGGERQTLMSCVDYELFA